jgi:hypothetical protein
MAISRMQQPRQLRNNGGIMQAVPRQGYFLGKLVKGAKKAVKGIAKGAKGLLRSDAGKLGLLALGGFGLAGKGPLGSLLGGIGGNLPGMFSNAVQGYKNLEGPAKFLAQAGIGTAIGGGLAALMDEEEETREIATQDVGSLKKYLASYYSNLGYTADQIAENVARDTSEYGYADGGRIGYAFGDKVEMAAGIEGLPVNINPKGVKELDLRETGGFIPPVGIKEKADDIPAMLSNNEFVFTADAVKAAGGGSVDKGAQIMYDTMKKLESKVV